MKPGRPKRGETREAMSMISVRLPASIVEEIDRRAALLPATVSGRKSAVVRELLEQALAKHNGQ